MDQCGICDILSVLGRLWVPVDIWNVRILHYGLLECMFGWVFHSDSVLRVMDTFDDDDDDDDYI
jgi:hypothetical protein